MSLTSRNRRHVLTTVMVVASVFLGARGTSWATQPERPAKAPVVRQAGGEAGPTVNFAAEPRAASLEETYASRETSAKDLEPFKGGDLVIVGSGGLVLVLLIILILVLV